LPDKKNNHFVPRSYLKRFCSGSERQIGLYNLKSGRIVDSAPIKSQCSRDYFYTKNPIFEDQFSKLETRQKDLLGKIIDTRSVPEHHSFDRATLSACVLFQAGRTATSAAHRDHMATEFGKAVLKYELTGGDRADLLEHLPKIKITQTNAVMESVAQHLVTSPLINDLACTLFINQTEEDFLTSDHPIARCNSLSPSRTPAPSIGFASRGLIIVYPISPRMLLLLSDVETYKVEKNSSGAAILKGKGDVVEMNLAQCGSAYENLYFASPARVQATLEAFRNRSTVERPPPSSLEERPVDRGVWLNMRSHVRRLSMPKVIQLRHASKTRKYKLGNDWVRDPLCVQTVKAESDRINKLREEVTQRAERERTR
jgi:hypothetical protein